MRRKDGGCDRWRSGLCAAVSVPLYCPRERADNCPPGGCSHHPLFDVRPMLEEMSGAGVKLGRYRERLRDPVFVRRLHAAFRRARRT